MAVGGEGYVWHTLGFGVGDDGVEVFVEGWFGAAADLNFQCAAVECPCCGVEAFGADLPGAGVVFRIAEVAHTASEVASGGWVDVYRYGSAAEDVHC